VGVCGEHVFKHDLVDHSAVLLGTACFAVLFVRGSIAASALGLAHN
jgi:hypothetical protein